MSCVFQNIDPPPPSPPGECALVAGEDTLAGWRGGWGVNILEDARRHSSVLYLYRILFVFRFPRLAGLLPRPHSPHRWNTGPYQTSLLTVDPYLIGLLDPDPEVRITNLDPSCFLEDRQKF
jgi:hypothetical protein